MKNIRSSLKFMALKFLKAKACFIANYYRQAKAWRKTKCYNETAFTPRL